MRENLNQDSYFHYVLFSGHPANQDTLLCPGPRASVMEVTGRLASLRKFMNQKRVGAVAQEA